MDADIQVYVCALDGEQLELSLSAQSTCADLKAAVAKIGTSPVCFQTLSVGVSVLKDADCLVDFLEDGSFTLTVTLVKSMNEALRHLTRGSRQSRQAALESIVQLVPRKVDKASAHALSTALEDVDFHEETRAAALKVLAVIAPAGDQLAIDTLTKRVADRSALVRSAAIHGLKRMVPEGDARVIVALQAYASGRPLDVKLAALKAIYAAAPGVDGGVCTVDALKLYMRTSDDDVRRKVSKVLSKLAARGNKYAVEALNNKDIIVAVEEDQDYHILYSDILPMRPKMNGKSMRLLQGSL
jgi:hypothetical protein